MLGAWCTVGIGVTVCSGSHLEEIARRRRRFQRLRVGGASHLPPRPFAFEPFSPGGLPEPTEAGGARSLAGEVEREREEEGSEARLGSRGGTTGSPNLHPWPRPLPPPPLVRRRTSRLSSRRRIFGNAGKLESPSWGKGPRGERGRGEKGGGRGRPSPKYSEGSGMRGR